MNGYPGISANSSSEDHSNRTRIETLSGYNVEGTDDASSEDHSNRTRIETSRYQASSFIHVSPQKIIPIEQGLKRQKGGITGKLQVTSEDHSNRTRIETHRAPGYT